MDPEGYSRLITRPLPVGTETIDLAEATGRILARDVFADAPVPAFATSAMDGYALDSTALNLARADAPVPVRGDVPAGHPATDLPPGSAVRVMTGAPVPAAAEVVVPVEYTDADRTGDAPAEILIGALPADVRPGWNIREVGEDLGVGSLVVLGGEALNAAGIGMLAMTGAETVEVRRPVHVGVIVTGDELGAGQGPRIPNSNLPMLTTALTAHGAIAHPATSSDDPGEFLSVLDGLLPDVDLVITTGGISAGAYEVVRAGLEGTGSRFLRLRQRPGGPQGYGERSGVPLLHFPGTPTGAFLSFHLFARSLLEGTELGHRWRTAVYAGPDLPGHVRGTSFVPVSFGYGGAVSPAARAGLRDFATADAILRLPPDPTVIANGDFVDILPCR